MINKDFKTNLTGNSTFQYYRDGALWYRNDNGLLFPVPVTDLGNSQVLATEKSTVFMKWIRRYLTEIETA